MSEPHARRLHDAIDALAAEAGAELARSPVGFWVTYPLSDGEVAWTVVHAREKRQIGKLLRAVAQDELRRRMASGLKGDDKREVEAWFDGLDVGGFVAGPFVRRPDGITLYHPDVGPAAPELGEPLRAHLAEVARGVPTVRSAADVAFDPGMPSPEAVAAAVADAAQGGSEAPPAPVRTPEPRPAPAASPAAERRRERAKAGELYRRMRDEVESALTDPRHRAEAGAIRAFVAELFPDAGRGILVQDVAVVARIREGLARRRDDPSWRRLAELSPRFGELVSSLDASTVWEDA